ncbi:MAG: ABC transporter ATP-binding protein [Clostridia bacterium]|nr:ABC transporter ATP-binding protein [Clostridia bacterium]
MLEVERLGVSVGNYTLLSGVDFTLSEGCWLMVAGPNGAGKSTLINALSGGAEYTGTVRLEGTDLREVSARRRARTLGVLAQQHDVSYPFTVEEVVTLGRYSHAPGLFSKGDGADGEKVEEALRLTGMLERRRQSVLTISGGELQRVFLAQLFAQEPSILLLDEPTNHLDIGYQAQLFPLIEHWLSAGGRAVLSVVHDLALARRYGNRAMLLHQGRVLALGSKEEVFTEDTLRAAYGIDVGAWMRDLYHPWQGG